VKAHQCLNRSRCLRREGALRLNLEALRRGAGLDRVGRGGCGGFEARRWRSSHLSHRQGAPPDPVPRAAPGGWGV